MKPIFNKSGIENILELIKASNPAAAIKVNQVTVGTPLDDVETGRSQLTITSVGDAGFSGSINVNYFRRSISEYMEDGKFVLMTGDETEEDVKEIISGHFGLVESEIEWNDFDLVGATENQISIIEFSSKTGLIYKGTASTYLVLSTVDLNQPTRGTEQGFRVDSQGRVRGLVPKPVKSGAGPATITKSHLNGFNQKIDFYGYVESEDFITASELASRVGLTAGTPMAGADEVSWAKVGFDGKILLFPLKTLRSGISWGALYTAGITDGSATTGNPGALTPVTQGKTVTINGSIYTVRLFRGARPGNFFNSIGYQATHKNETDGSEWNEIMYRFSAGSPISSKGRFDSLSSEELNTHRNPANNVPGSYTWCQETSTREGNGRLLRGWDGVEYASGYTYTYAAAFTGWRPVLEYLGEEKDLKPVLDGDQTEGVCEFVPSSFFGDELQLLTDMGVSPSSLMNAGKGWFNFRYHGRDLYVRSATISADETWATLYTKGLIFGTDIPQLSSLTRPKKSVEIVRNGRRYMVMTLPIFPTHQSWVVDSYLTNGSMWGKTLGKVISTSFGGSGLWNVVSGANEHFVGSTSGELFGTYGQQSSSFNGWGTISANMSSARHVSTNAKIAWRPVLVDMGPVVNLDYGEELDTGHGSPTVLTTRTGAYGGLIKYYGFIDNEDFIEPNRLNDWSGLTAGTIMEAGGWYKFEMEGKKLFIPKKAIRYNVSHNDLLSAGLVDGGRQIKIGENTYKVRLMTTLAPGKTTSVSGNHASHSAESEGSEWNELVYRLSINNPRGTGDSFVTLSDVDLGVSSAITNGRSTWTSDRHGDGETWYIHRGNTTVSYLQGNGSTSRQAHMGWRPVLELVE